MHRRRHVHVGLPGNCLQLGGAGHPLQPLWLRATSPTLVGFQVLRQRHFHHCTALASIANFKSVNDFEPQMHQRCAHPAIRLLQTAVEPFRQPRPLRVHIGRIGHLVIHDVGLSHAGRVDWHGCCMVMARACVNFLDAVVPGRGRGRLPALQVIVAQRLLALFDGRLGYVKRVPCVHCAPALWHWPCPSARYQ